MSRAACFGLLHAGNLDKAHVIRADDQLLWHDQLDLPAGFMLDHEDDIAAGAKLEDAECREIR